MLGRPLLAFLVATSALACSAYGTSAVAQDAGADADADADAGVDVGPVDLGGPHLTALDVSSSDGSGSMGLVPAFSPFVFDYYVRCAEGKNAVTVSMTAAPGATSALYLPTTSRSAPTETHSLDLREGQAIVVTATAEAQTTEYWVRCLPHNFPQIRMEAYPGAPTPLPGYYLIGNSGTTPGYPMVLDGNGVPVWYFENAVSGVDDVDHVVPGAISFFLTWMPTLSLRYFGPLMTSQVMLSGTELDGHDLRVLPNGDYLVFSNPLVTGVDLSGLIPQGLDGPRGRTVIGGEPAYTQMFDCEVVEFDPKTGAVVWTWTASEHFDPLIDSIDAAVATEYGVMAVDAFHCNSIDVDPANGNLLVSSRNMSSVFYIDRSTGAVVWKMGGSSYTKDNSIYVPVEDPFVQQHDARLQPGWSEATGTGQVSVFDDQSDTMAPARGLLLDVTTGVGGTTPKATVAWQYKGNGGSSNRGSFRISADGSRVIGWGANPSMSHCAFTEVDDGGHALLDFFYDDGNVSYRAIKVPLSTFDLGLLRRTAGLP
jgi:outer membrane protein assembly factor BamB